MNNHYGSKFGWSCGYFGVKKHTLWLGDLAVENWPCAFEIVVDSVLKWLEFPCVKTPECLIKDYFQEGR